MDFAPFPSISNVGYAEIASVKYDLPCGLRRHQVPKMVAYDNNNTFQMSFWRKSFDEDKGLEEKVAVADSRILLRPRRFLFPLTTIFTSFWPSYIVFLLLHP